MTGEGLTADDGEAFRAEGSTVGADQAFAYAQAAEQTQPLAGTGEQCDLLSDWQKSKHNDPNPDVSPYFYVPPEPGKPRRDGFISGL